MQENYDFGIPPRSTPTPRSDEIVRGTTCEPAFLLPSIIAKFGAGSLAPLDLKQSQILPSRRDHRSAQFFFSGFRGILVTFKVLLLPSCAWFVDIGSQCCVVFHQQKLLLFSKSSFQNEVVASFPGLVSSRSSTFSPPLNYDTRWRLRRSQTFDGPSFSHSCRVSYPMLFRKDACMQDDGKRGGDRIVHLLQVDSFSVQPARMKILTLLHLL